MQSQPYIRNDVGVKFVSNEIQMTLNQTNHNQLQKDNFEFVQDVEH